MTTARNPQPGFLRALRRLLLWLALMSCAVVLLGLADAARAADGKASGRPAPALQML